MKINKQIMNGKLVATGLILIATGSLFAGSRQKDYVMKVDGEEVPVEEFIYLYQKNNLQQQEPQSIDDYLKLYEIYRLKVAEAKSQGVDTTETFKKEMAQYRRELLEPYITDSAFIDKMVDIAEARDKELVESSHIMIIRTHNEEKDKKNLALLDSLRTELLNGADFIEIAKNYSHDKISSDKGGYLGFNPAGTFPYGFETAVYETPEGEISEIVESHVGWHIVKSGARKSSEEANRKLKTREELLNDLTRQSASPFDTRYHEIRKNTISRLMNRHPELATSLEGKSEDEVYEILLSAEEDSQYDNNADYRNLVDEYVNGSLLYEVEVENVWNKAANDTEGLQNFYETHKDRYKWTVPHAKGLLVQTLNDSVTEVIKANIKELPADSVGKFIRKNHRKEALVERFNLPKGANPMIDYALFGGPEAKPKIRPLTSFFVVDARIVEQPENLNDVKNEVVSDYQEIIENEWVEKLRNTHTIELNGPVLDKLRKETSN